MKLSTEQYIFNTSENENIYTIRTTVNIKKVQQWGCFIQLSKSEHCSYDAWIKIPGQERKGNIIILIIFNNDNEISWRQLIWLRHGA